jgi:bifunctional DNase/RNase
MLNMEGTDKQEVAYLREKAKVWAKHIRMGVLTKNDGWYDLNTNVMKKLEGSIAAICISKKELGYVMAPVVLETRLNAIQFSSNLPRAIK